MSNKQAEEPQGKRQICAEYFGYTPPHAESGIVRVPTRKALGRIVRDEKKDPEQQ